MIPRQPLHDYQNILRGHDIGLSLMYSPHPSLVPIEMAAAGMLTVTNRLCNKTEEQLHAISPNFVVTDATVDGVRRGLRHSVRRVGQYPERVAGARVNWSRSWDEAFDVSVRNRFVRFLEMSSQ
jgi:hypothetical protein